MSIPYEVARDLWAKRQIIAQAEEAVRLLGGSTEPVYEFGNPHPIGRHVPAPEDLTIIDIDIDPGGEYQIGDMTWDYDSPSIEITYKESGHQQKTSVELDFAQLVQQILAVAEELMET